MLTLYVTGYTVAMLAQVNLRVATATLYSSNTSNPATLFDTMEPVLIADADERICYYVAPDEQSVAAHIITHWEKAMDEFVFEGLNLAYESDDLKTGVDCDMLVGFSKKIIAVFLEIDARGGFLRQEDPLANASSSRYLQFFLVSLRKLPIPGHKVKNAES